MIDASSPTSPDTAVALLPTQCKYASIQVLLPSCLCLHPIGAPNCFLSCCCYSTIYLNLCSLSLALLWQPIRICAKLCAIYLETCAYLVLVVHPDADDEHSAILDLLVIHK